MYFLERKYITHWVTKCHSPFYEQDVSVQDKVPLYRNFNFSFHTLIWYYQITSVPRECHPKGYMVSTELKTLNLQNNLLLQQSSRRCSKQSRDSGTSQSSVCFHLVIDDLLAHSGTCQGNPSRKYTFTEAPPDADMQFRVCKWCTIFSSSSFFACQINKGDKKKIPNHFAMI